ncbi:MAG: PfkB family carbohydrate kinase [Spirochaetes bacterium]|nr:PfkB family carbohydrate kinase [Spirochaetota bacterium]
MMVLVVCLNPTLQKTLVFSSLREGEVNRTPTYYLDASGKGVNVARVLEQLQIPTIHLTHAGGMLRNLFLTLAEQDILRIIAPDSGSEVRFCTTLLNLEKGTTTELVEEAKPVSPDTEKDVRDRFQTLLPESDCVVISGTRAPGYTGTLYAEFVLQAKEAGKRVILDIRGKDLIDCLPYRPDVVKTNLAEFISTFLGKSPEKEQIRDNRLMFRVEEEFSRLAEEYGVVCITTNGKEDTLFYNRGNVFHAPVYSDINLRVLNTTGCGDAFLAGFLKAWKEEGFPAPSSEVFQAGLEGYIREAHRVAFLNAVHVRPGRIR